MRFPRAQSQFCQRIENLAALDFQLARQIVDSNLAHPPLFKFCYPKPARCSWLPHGIGCWFHFHYYRFGLSKRQRIFSPPSLARHFSSCASVSSSALICSLSLSSATGVFSTASSAAVKLCSSALSSASDSVRAELASRSSISAWAA